MCYIGIDIGSTAAKLAVINDNDEIILKRIIPTGWSSPEAAKNIRDFLAENSIFVETSKVVATGYGRISVPYAHKTITEITCHAKGATYLFGKDDCTIIDIGGQDTKIISVSKGFVLDFLMNDKCSAGTGRFLEICANTLGVDIEGLCNLAQKGGNVTINSMCTVFAESEIISLIGQGESKENIAYGIVESIVTKVATLCTRCLQENQDIFLTGGLCDSEYILNRLSIKLNSSVKSVEDGRFAGAIGAALLAKNIKK